MNVGAASVTAIVKSWVLVSDPAQTLLLLEGQMRPAADVDHKQIARLITELDSDDFKRRERAERELAVYEQMAESALGRTSWAAATLNASAGYASWARRSAGSRSTGSMSGSKRRAQAAVRES